MPTKRVKKSKKKAPPQKVQLGDRVKDSITGFKGIVTGRTEYLHGCTVFGVKPETMHEGKTIGEHWFDEPRLVVVKAGVHELDTRTIGDSKPGGPRAVPSGVSG